MKVGIVITDDALPETMDGMIDFVAERTPDVEFACVQESVERVVLEMGYKCQRFKPNEVIYGVASRYKRNTEMVKVCDLVVGFWDIGHDGCDDVHHTLTMARLWGKPIKVNPHISMSINREKLDPGGAVAQR